jgi:hypothetical protein
MISEGGWGLAPRRLVPIPVSLNVNDNFFSQHVVGVGGRQGLCT